MKTLLLISSLFLSGIAYSQDFRLKYDGVEKFDHGLALTIKNGSVIAFKNKQKVIINISVKK